MPPLAIDLFCGLGGWTEGLLAEGWDVIGFDIEVHQYGDAKYPAQLVLQDVLTLHGSQFKDAALIVASPPCQEFSYMAMPWSLAKKKQRMIEADPSEQKRLTALFDACFRIQREACEAAGKHIPMVVENVRGAQKWVGRAPGHFGSFYLWGDVPALMPTVKPRAKVGGITFSGHGTPGYKGQAFNSTAEKRMRELTGRKLPGNNPMNDAGIKQGSDWFNASQPSISRRCSSKSKARKAASAAIAKIPFVLASHIARTLKPME